MNLHGSFVQMPPAVAGCFTADVGLATVYVLDLFAGRPFENFSRLIDLNGEANLPTWYSSVQLLAVGVLLGLFAWPRIQTDRARRARWLLAVLPVLFVFFSMDEVAVVHERLGLVMSTRLLAGTRLYDVAQRGTLWVLFLGPPFILLAFLGVWYARPYWRGQSAAIHKFAWGGALYGTSAAVTEILWNVVEPGTLAWVAQIVCEELGEMTGVTFVLWGAYLLLSGSGLVVSFAGDRGTGPRSLTELGREPRG